MKSIGACIADDRYSSAGDCPSGMIAVDKGDGTFACLTPSISACSVGDLADDGQLNSSNAGAGCSFEYGGVTATGVCAPDDQNRTVCFAECQDETGQFGPGEGSDGIDNDGDGEIDEEGRGHPYSVTAATSCENPPLVSPGRSSGIARERLVLHA